MHARHLGQASGQSRSLLAARRSRHVTSPLWLLDFCYSTDVLWVPGHYAWECAKEGYPYLSPNLGHGLVPSCMQYLSMQAPGLLGKLEVTPQSSGQRQPQKCLGAGRCDGDRGKELHVSDSTSQGRRDPT